MRVGPVELTRLGAKYRALAELRRAGAPDESDADRARLRAVAAEFPGALRELDTLPTDELDARAAALDVAAAGGAVAPWMLWLHAYHALMRAALRVKRASAGVGVNRPRGMPARGGLSEQALAELAAEAGLPLDERFVADVLAPPHGRLNVVVFARLGALFGERPRAIWDTLFPPRAGRRDYRGD
jgi:hypothetical protein